MDHLIDVVDLAEFETAVPHAFFIEFHGKGDGTGGGDGVHAHLIDEVVPADDGVEVVVQEVRTHEAEDLEFGALDVFAVDFAAAGTLDDAGRAAGVPEQSGLSQRLTGDFVEAVELTAVEVLGREDVPGLHGRDKASRTKLRYLAAGQCVIPERFAPFAGQFPEPFFVDDGRMFEAFGRDRFDLLVAEDRADTAASVGTLAGHDGSVENLVLTGGADDQVRAVALRKGFLRGRDFEPPEFGGIVEEDFVFRDLDVDRCLGFTGDDAAVIAAAFQHQTEVAAAVGGRDESRQRRNGRDIETGRTGGTGTGQGACRDDDPVIFIVGSHSGTDVTEQDIACHDLAADGAVAVFIGPGVLRDSVGAQVDH